MSCVVTQQESPAAAAGDRARVGPAMAAHEVLTARLALRARPHAAAANAATAG
jgi:hypothetical protein